MMMMGGKKAAAAAAMNENGCANVNTFGRAFAVCVCAESQRMTLIVSAFASAFNGNIAPLLPSFPLIFFLPP